MRRVELSLENASVEKKPSLIGMIYSPKEQIQRIKKYPIFWGAWIWFFVFLSTFLGVNGYYQVNDPENVKSMLELLSPDVREKIDVESLKTTILTMIVFGGLLVSIILPLGSAIVLWIFSRLLRGKASFKQLLSFQVYLLIIYILSMLLHDVIMIVIGKNLPVSPTSLALLIPSTGVIQSILSSIDLFSVWIAILIGLGMKEIAEFSKVKATFMGAGYILLLIVLSIISV